MLLLSVNVGGPREVEWRGETVRTSIWKAPVPGRVAVRRTNLAGDEQSDLRVHGGTEKAVYVYPHEHYAYWQGELPDVTLGFGNFGENLTSTGLLEAEVSIGDRLRIGSAEFRVTQPRVPCFKLGIRFGRPEMVKRFLAAGRSGFYLAVLREGELGAGDAIERIPVATPSLRVAEVADLHAGRVRDPERLRFASELADLPQGWRDGFREALGARLRPRRSASA
jgi:MOSC domain-containing protein YiiM